MKKLYSLIALLAMCGTMVLTAQNRVVQIMKDGSVLQSFPVEQIDSIIINEVLGAPTNLKATLKDGDILVSWDEIAGATYNLYRSPDDKSYVLLASGLTANSYTDASPIAGTNYYKAQAVIDGKESLLSSTPAIVSTDGSDMESGVYLGIIGFNQSLYTYPLSLLTAESKSGYDSFIDGMTMKNGTLLCYSVDEAINALKAATLPADVSTVALVTFTDGLDQGSLMVTDKYLSDDDYLAALKDRIGGETVADQNLLAYSIGLRGSDITSSDDIAKFRSTLKQLASSDENATEVTSMSEVNAKFQEIAEQLSQTRYLQTISLKMPGLSDGTRVRFTFDNVSSAENSNIYIEGTFKLRERSLTDVEYHGMVSTSGSVISGVTEGIFVTFTFENVQTADNKRLPEDYITEWYLTSASSWQINSEFDGKENSDIIYEQSSAVIMLVLDCSSSLGTQFSTAQSNAKSFITTLCNSSDDDDSNDGYIEGGFTTYTVNGVSFRMAHVKGGTFTMGATSEQLGDADSDEKPAHQVTLSDYYIGETEVTQELWKAVMGSNPSYFTGNLQRPVEQVSWNDCQAFIRKLNELTGANFRLPTEAEWEYAARGGAKAQGNLYSGSYAIGDVAWYTSNSSSTTHPVKTKQPNELGLYDMSGNVWEWCADWYGSSYYSSSPQTNPTGPSSGSYRVLRGGGWGSDATYCRVADRYNDAPSDTYSGSGLRLSL